MKDKLVVWSILVTLMIIAILPGFASAQVVSGSVNTPSGYSIDYTTGNLIPYDSSLKTDTNVSTQYGYFLGSFNASDGYTFGHVSETIGFSSINLGAFPHGYQNTNAVFVTGFMYGLKYRFPCANQIGGTCDDVNGLQDNLQVEVGYYPANNGAPTFYIHQLGLKNINDGNSPYNPTWQDLAETVTFAGAKTLAQAGSVNMSIIGNDAGYWACIMPDCYGPQVKDAYIRANYSVDPCILNPAFSSNCPGFSNIVQGGNSPLYWWGYNIATRLPHIGGGVQVHGFDYGFGWYAGEYCTLTIIWCWTYSGANGGTINFRITDSGGNELYKDSRYREGNYSGGGYSNRFLFTETQNSLSLGSIQWYATGVWGDNFQWSGWTRPIWTPDPCYTQPLYSPNCSNFNATIQQLAEEQEAARQTSLASTVSSVSTTSTSTITTTITDPNTTSPTVAVVTDTPPPPPPPPPDSGLKPPPPQFTSAPVPKEEIREVQPRQESVAKSAPRVETLVDSTSLALNLIRQNQQRETNIGQQASQTAIQTANIAATTSMRQAESLAFDSAKTSQIQEKENQGNSADVVVGTVKQSELLAVGPQPGSTSVVSIGQQSNSQQQAVTEIALQQNSQSTSAVVIFNAMQINATSSTTQEVALVQPITQSFQPVTQQSVYQQSQVQAGQEIKPQEINQQNFVTASNSVPTLQAPQQIIETATPVVQAITQQTIVSTEIPQIASLQTQLPVVNVDLPQTQQTFTTDPTNVLNSVLDNKPNIPDEEVKQTNLTSVNQKTEDNTLASGVSINTISVVPVGFSAYTVALADANFYQPKEIYRNQRTIDNRRALQNLRSDSLHEQMKDQQWR